MGTPYRTLIDRLISSLKAISSIIIHPAYAQLSLTFEIGTVKKIRTYASLEEMYHILLLIFEAVQRDCSMTPQQIVQELWATVNQWDMKDVQALNTAFFAGDMTTVMHYFTRFHHEMIRTRIEHLIEELGMNTLATRF